MADDTEIKLTVTPDLATFERMTSIRASLHDSADWNDVLRYMAERCTPRNKRLQGPKRAADEEYKAHAQHYWELLHKRFYPLSKRTNWRKIARAHPGGDRPDIYTVQLAADQPKYFWQIPVKNLNLGMAIALYATGLKLKVWHKNDKDNPFPGLTWTELTEAQANELGVF
jgi:hypothetical protein